MKPPRLQRVKRVTRSKPATVLRSVHSTRCKNLLSLVGDGRRFVSQNQLATALELHDGSYISQLTGPNPRRRFTETIARRFEYKLKLVAGWLDVER